MRFRLLKLGVQSTSVFTDRNESWLIEGESRLAQKEPKQSGGEGKHSPARGLGLGTDEIVRAPIRIACNAMRPSIDHDRDLRGSHGVAEWLQRADAYVRTGTLRHARSRASSENRFETAVISRRGLFDHYY
jgi:hypothetical protein